MFMRPSNTHSVTTESDSYPGRRRNTKIVQLRANTELRRNLFSIRVVKVWNRLPEKIVIEPS